MMSSAFMLFDFVDAVSARDVFLSYEMFVFEKFVLFYNVVADIGSMKLHDVVKGPNLKP